MNLSDSPGRPACPSRASGWSSLTTPRDFPCCARFPCVHAVATTPAQPLAVPHRSSVQWCQPSPKGSSGRPAHRHFRGLLGVHSRYGLHTRAVTVNRDPLPEGFQSLRYLHDCSGLLPAGAFAGWGLHPLEKRRLITAHTHCCPSNFSRCEVPWEPRTAIRNVRHERHAQAGKTRRSMSARWKGWASLRCRTVLSYSSVRTCWATLSTTTGLSK